MTKTAAWLLLIAAGAYAAHSAPATTRRPPPPPAAVSGPEPEPAFEARPTLGGLTSPDGSASVTCDLPASEKKRNVGGRDGAGLCVFTSIEWASRWQNEPRLWDFQQKMRAEKGGGWPEKLDQMIERYAPGVQYVQHTGGDMEFLARVLKTGRMPGVTYGGYDPHYRGYVAHMVNLIHLDGRWAAVSDNNFPGDGQVVWMSADEFKRRWLMGGGGWAVALAAPPPTAKKKG